MRLLTVHLEGSSEIKLPVGILDDSHSLHSASQAISLRPNLVQHEGDAVSSEFTSLVDIGRQSPVATEAPPSYRSSRRVSYNGGTL